MGNDDDHIPQDPPPDPVQNAWYGTGAVGLTGGVAFLIFWLSGWLYTANKHNDPGVFSCSTSCIVFLRYECPGGRYTGTCFDFKICDKPTHPCGVNPAEVASGQHKSRLALLPGDRPGICRREVPIERAKTAACSKED